MSPGASSEFAQMRQKSQLAPYWLNYRYDVLWQFVNRGKRDFFRSVIIMDTGMMIGCSGGSRGKGCGK